MSRKWLLQSPMLHTIALCVDDHSLHTSPVPRLESVPFVQILHYRSQTFVVVRLGEAFQGDGEASKEALVSIRNALRKIRLYGKEELGEH
ncbi:hypothetical protein Lal_00037924 [Lupinus albus]|nr:hypothetical protein Lal_00037924 [Lupinus albus]